MIDIMKEHVQCLYALGQSGPQRFPFGRGNHAWNDVERNQTFLAGFLSVDRKGDPDSVKRQIRLCSLAGDTLGRRGLKPVIVSFVVLPDASVGVNHLVIEVHFFHSSLSMLSYRFQQIPCHPETSLKSCTRYYFRTIDAPQRCATFSTWCKIKKPPDRSGGFLT